MSAGQPEVPERRRVVAERTLATRRIYDGHIISLRVDAVELADGHRSSREVVEHRGAVAILPWDGERLTLVRQWRQPVAQELLEIPAGTIDPGEEPLVTARRELAEETGIVAERWEAGPEFYTAPGFCTERLFLYLATDLRQAEATGPADEVIEVTQLSLAAALEAVDRGAVADAKSIVGILWLARRLAE